MRSNQIEKYYKLTEMKIVSNIFKYNVVNILGGIRVKIIKPALSP